MNIRETLNTVAARNNARHAEVVVLPSAIIVSSDVHGHVSTRAVSTGFRPLTFHQVDAVDRVARSARDGRLAPTQIQIMVRLRREEKQPFRAYQRVLAYAVASGALSVLLGASTSGVLIATVLGVVVGTFLAVSRRLPGRTRPLVTFGSAFLVSVTVFWLLNVTAVDAGVLPSLVAPLVIFLPGAILTTSVVELTTGQIVSGGARLAAGFMQLILLALGIVAASTLVGVPAVELGPAQQPLGVLAPWVAVAVFGISIGVHQSAAPYALPWITLVLYVAYSVQVLVEPVGGAVISGFIAALVMTPVAAHVARHGGPPAIVPFLPAFWLLVRGPGARRSHDPSGRGDREFEHHPRNGVDNGRRRPRHSRRQHRSATPHRHIPPDFLTILRGEPTLLHYLRHMPAWRHDRSDPTSPRALPPRMEAVGTRSRLRDHRRGDRGLRAGNAPCPLVAERHSR